MILCKDKDQIECHKPIEDIEVGDQVWAYDEETGECDWKPVVRLFRNETKEWYHITVAGEEIVCTGGHPFYVVGVGFVFARDLKTGDLLRFASGEQMPIETIRVQKLAKPETTYNFEVADFHTYYVGKGTILVHNKCKEALFNDFEKHAFSRNHKNSGIENLGSTHREIFDKVYDEVMIRVEQAVERSNQIYTNINNIDVTIRFYVYNGEILRINAMVGRTIRVLGKLLI